MRFAATATPQARALWEVLDSTQQIALLARVAGRLQRARRMAFPQLGSDVVRVGYGRRERRSGLARRVRHRDDLALLVYVRRKWAKEEPPRRSLAPVPAWISVRASIPEALVTRSRALGAKVLAQLRRRRSTRSTRVIGIPTDVRQVGPSGRAESAQVVYVSSTLGPTIRGSACVPVREVKPNAPLGLLGCHHVLWRSLKMPAAARDPNSQAQDMLGTALGPTSPAFNLRPLPVESNVDAAVLELAIDGARKRVTDPAFWRFTKAERPVTCVQSQREILLLLTSLGETAYLYPPAVEGAPRRLELELLEFDIESTIDYDYASVSLAELAIFRPVGGATQGGYSGSPVVAGGVLIGMHVAGLNTVRPDGSPLVRSFVQPAYRMIPRGVHNLRLALATNSIRF